MSELGELENLIVAKGNEIRDMKANKADKAAIKVAVDDLLALKEKYKAANNGVPYGGEPVKEAPKEKKEKAPVEEVKREGPSKKELNKLKKKEKKANYKEETETSAPSAAPTSAVPTNAAPIAAGKLAIYVSSAPAPVAGYVGALVGRVLPVLPSPTPTPHVPYLFSASSGSISGDLNIARYLCRAHQPSLLHSTDAWLSSQVDQWLEFASTSITNAANLVETHLTQRTFLVGDSLSLADIAVYTALGNVNTAAMPCTARWQTLIKSLLPAPAKTAAPAGKKPAVVDPADDGSSVPALEDAVEGQVITRFPPEPSGYLHIGHAKAVLLNQYYAQRYKGKLIVRFDDTNPSKEKEEFEDNIIKDLATLNVKPDIVTHTSDSFEICQKLAFKMIEEGKAYMDNTDQETMQAERLAKVESKHRNTDPETNKRIFAGLLAGEDEFKNYCLRAKIDMSSVNGTMRDPVLYRYNNTPHHKTGTKYKAYPTYDFACPIVDSIEGVTHALRTTEYNDRDEQYAWLQDAMGLRKVHIQAFGKINFVYTVLSKRKLNWFVENKLVEGWFDPRFPTIQGCIRRGVNVDALKKFILKQGASRRVILMEWDKFWSENKMVLEEIAHRYMAVSRDTAVGFTVTNWTEGEVSALIPLHPQKPDMGTRVLRRSSTLLLERDDVKTFNEGEEVTLLRWGNFIIDKIVKDDSGNILSVEARHNAAATNFSKTKKATWIANNADLVPCQLVEFDHLINKPKLLEDESFIDFITPVSKAETAALGDPSLRHVQQGQVVQLERKGFYRCDRPYGGSPDKPIMLFLIPDGRQKAMSTLSSALTHR